MSVYHQGEYVPPNHNSLPNRKIEVVKIKISKMIPGLVEECLNCLDSQTIYYQTLVRYGARITKIMEDNFSMVLDFEDLCYWLGIDNSWVRKPPYHSNRDINAFFNIYKQRDNGLCIVDKITSDLFELRYKLQINGYDDSEVCVFNGEGV